MLRLPRNEAGLLLLCLILCAGVYRAGLEIERLKAQLAARPEILVTAVDTRSEDVRRGPVTITRKTTTTPQGVKTVESTREIGAVETHTEAKREDAKKETPVQAAPERARTRYVGLAVNPLDYARVPRFRGGVTLWSAVDLGVATDFRHLWVESSYRF
jgi:hypothetical protein